MAVVNTNTSSLIARNAMRVADKDLTQAMERLSTGLRINTAADDAAGLSISERLTSQSRGMNQAMRNAQDGISLIQTAEGAMGTISDILQRMRELSVQADNGTNSNTDLVSIQAEITALTAEIDHIAGTSTFNGIQLLDGSVASVDLHISEKATDTISVALTKVTSAEILGGALDVTADAQAAITAIDTAIDKVSDARGNLGATQNRLDFIIDNLATAVTNTDASNSRIQDADMAAESSELTRAQIIAQTSQAMLGKANQQPQQITQLLQG